MTGTAAVAAAQPAKGAFPLPLSTPPPMQTLSPVSMFRVRRLSCRVRLPEGMRRNNLCSKETDGTGRQLGKIVVMN